MLAADLLGQRIQIRNHQLAQLEYYALTRGLRCKSPAPSRMSGDCHGMLNRGTGSKGTAGRFLTAGRIVNGAGTAVRLGVRLASDKVFDATAHVPISPYPAPSNGEPRRTTNITI
jgi:hypothetical protein